MKNNTTEKKGIFGLPPEKERALIEKAAHEANKEQRELVDKYDQSQRQARLNTCKA